MPLATAPAQTDSYPVFFNQSCSLISSNQRFELLHLDIQQDATEALFFARGDCLITSNFPGFEKNLLRLLPGLLDNVECRNGCSHHFATELLATETGHLFEHIWLEVLCSEKLQTAEMASYSGETTWNWHRDPLGLFRIRLSAGVEDVNLIERTAFISQMILERSLEPVEEIG